MEKPRLEVELVPRSCFFSNLRSNLKPKVWEGIRQKVIHAADHRCEICGSSGGGYSLECHEIWHYDDETGVQSLIGLVALCKACHRAKHLALARAKGWENAARSHIMRVNRWDILQTHQHIEEAFVLFETRSQMEWALDIDWLIDFGVEIPENLDRLKKKSS